ncbi:MAG TPA: hypothetical protein VF263_14605 [Longimicrobiaceae bacterium]
MNDWQRGGDKKKRGPKLKLESQKIDPEFRRTGLVCFRQIALEPEFLWKLGDDLFLDETISAWTTDTEIAATFKGGVPPEGYQGVIFEVLPEPGQVVLNLTTLYRSAEFKSACETYKSQIPGYGDGIGRYGASQAEVVLEISRLTLGNVYALGGHSSSKQELVEVLFGLSPRSDQVRTFEELLARSGQELGPRWVRGEVAQRVTGKLLDHVDRLRPHHPKYRDS